MKFRTSIGLFAATLVQTATQTKELGCGICWDGSIGKELEG
jgi:hypothetical protein